MSWGEHQTQGAAEPIRVSLCQRAYQTRQETPFVGLVEENAGDLGKTNPAPISLLLNIIGSILDSDSRRGGSNPSGATILNVQWCIGRTGVFDTLRLGSNPSWTAI